MDRSFQRFDVHGEGLESTDEGSQAGPQITDEECMKLNEIQSYDEMTTKIQFCENPVAKAFGDIMHTFSFMSKNCQGNPEFAVIQANKVVKIVDKIMTDLGADGRAEYAALIGAMDVVTNSMKAALATKMLTEGDPLALNALATVMAKVNESETQPEPFDFRMFGPEHHNLSLN
jgi:hypothetical protein